MNGRVQYGSGQRQPGRPEAERSECPVIGETNMSVAYLEKHDPTRNMQRFYRITVAPTLFGEFAMVREWGRIGQRGGSRIECWFASEEEARRAALEMAVAKRRRGYQPLQAYHYTVILV